MLSEDWLKYIPQQWVGILALVMFFATLITHLIEKYPLIAKVLPLGTWWHDRVKRKRREYIAEDNEVIANLSNQVELLVKDMREMRDDLRCLRAWSVYDARWHHHAEVSSAECDYELPRHYDYFEFERIWRNDSLAAARLSFLEETLEGPT